MTRAGLRARSQAQPELPSVNAAERERSCAGLYKTLIPETFPAERDATLGDSEWTVRVIYR